MHSYRLLVPILLVALGCERAAPPPKASPTAAAIVPAVDAAAPAAEPASARAATLPPSVAPPLPATMAMPRAGFATRAGPRWGHERPRVTVKPAATAPAEPAP